MLSNFVTSRPDLYEKLEKRPFQALSDCPQRLRDTGLPFLTWNRGADEQLDFQWLAPEIAEFWVSDLGLASNAINLPSMNPYFRQT
jgi:hypothetical protein